MSFKCAFILILSVIVLVPTSLADYEINGSTGWVNSCFENSTIDISDSKVRIGNITDNWDDANYDGWTVLTGNWNVVNEQLKANGTETSAYIKLNTTPQNNISVLVKAKQESIGTYRGFQIQFRYQDESNRYVASYNGNADLIGLYKYVGGSETILDTQAITSDNEFHLFAVNVAGQNARVLLDDVVVIDWTALGNDFTSGKVVLGCWFNSYNSTFDNLSIRTLDGSNNSITTGNVTHWHDAGLGYWTASFITNVSTQTNTNYTVWYADNGSTFSQIGGTYTGNQTPSISGTKYQNTDLRIVMNGNTTASPEEIGVTFVTEASGTAPNITSWQNNLTNSSSLDLVIELFSSVLFNGTANQTISTWNWFFNKTNQNNNFDNLSYYFDKTGYYNVEVNATSANGTSNTIQWNNTVKQVPEVNVNVVIT